VRDVVRVTAPIAGRRSDGAAQVPTARPISQCLKVEIGHDSSLM